ncbi:MAG TPA: NAD(P)-dependent oxidoreductase [Candidatus Acidoferrales bacterium]|nr:NAD(P)-dependent oxidoreductase [Candidatus Acidoferrales bacterium]
MKPSLRNSHVNQAYLRVSLRIAADAVMLNAAVAAALGVSLLHRLTESGLQSQPTAQTLVLARSYIHAYASNAIWLTALCLIVFGLSGFYSYGRLYRGRYKAAVISQAVSFAYLLFGVGSYGLGRQLFPGIGAWILAWLATVGILLASRLWTRMWQRVSRMETQLGIAHRDEVRNVLVIGGAGYIGSLLVPQLIENGHNVRVLDLLLYGRESIAHFATDPRVEVVQADFRQVDKVVGAMTDIDAVVHLGALVGDSACALNKELTVEINLMATRMIAEVAKGCRVGRLVFASTCSVYGASDKMLHERSELNPISLYARSKIASERVLLAMANEHFAPTCLRLATLYGLSRRTRFDLAVNVMTARAVLEGIILIAGGEQSRPFLHVQDAGLAILQTLTAPLAAVRGDVFNVGSSKENYTIREVGEIIHQFVPAAKMVINPIAEDRRNYRVNFDKIRETIGFVPQLRIQDGVGEIIEVIRSGKVTDYLNPKYSNAKYLSDETSPRLHSLGGWASDLIDSDPQLTTLAPSGGPQAVHPGQKKWAAV